MQSIKLFGIALEGNNFSYEKIAQKALQVGYIVDKMCSTKEVYDYLCNLDINPNTTFYQTWEDITQKDRRELYIDQVLHYLSTYGTNYTSEPYIPNKKSGKVNTSSQDFSGFKIIKSATQDEIIKRSDMLLNTNIALQKETIEGIFEIYDRYNYLPNIEKIQNKEAKIKIYEYTNTLPNSSIEVMRFMIYQATGQYLLIKNKETFQKISESNYDITNICNQYGIEKLSEIFYRNKMLFLAFKKAHPNNKKIINIIRRQAKIYHKPYQKGYREDVLNDTNKLKQLPEKIGEISNFKKIMLWEKVMNSESKYVKYTIRNGKYFIKEREKKQYYLIDEIIYTSLVADIKEKHKGKTFYIPEYLEIALPKSEKTFIGNIPLGTKIRLPDKDLVIGINRKEKDGCYDFDLSFIDINLDKVGRDSEYNQDGEVFYSGDMTTANPSATELLYFKDTKKEGLISNNRFNGEKNSKYTFFVAQEDCSSCKKNYMVKKENILFQTEITSTQRQAILGVKISDGLLIQNIIASNKQVANGNTITSAYIDISLNYQYLSLKQVLLDAGLKFSKQANPDFDFSNLNKDLIISLLS